VPKICNNFVGSSRRVSQSSFNFQLYFLFICIFLLLLFFRFIMFWTGVNDLKKINFSISKVSMFSKCFLQLFFHHYSKQDSIKHHAHTMKLLCSYCNKRKINFSWWCVCVIMYFYEQTNDDCLGWNRLSWSFLLLGATTRACLARLFVRDRLRRYHWLST